VDTFELLPSLAQGDLSETSAPELVAAVFRSRASGTLWIETPDGLEIRTYFRAGDMCGTAPFDGFHTLAHVLLANDWCSALDIDSSRDEAVAQKKRHGEVLVAKGHLTPDQLRAALVAQHTSNLGLLLSRTTGKYDWRGWEPPPAWAREVVVDPGAALLEALAQDQHEARRKKVLKWLGDVPARLSLDWPELQGRLVLDPLERRAAATLALPRRLQEFVAASRLSQARGEALLVALLLLGAAEPQPKPAVSAPPPQVSDRHEEIAIDPFDELLADSPPPPSRPPSRPIPVPQTRITTPPPQPRVSTPPPQAKAPPSTSRPPTSPQPTRPPTSPQPSRPSTSPQPQVSRPPTSPQRPPTSPQRSIPPKPAVARDADDMLDLLLQPDPPADEPALELDTSRSERRAAFEDQAMAELDALLTDEPPLEIDDGRKAATHGVPVDQPPGSDESNARELRKKMVARGMRNLGANPLAAGTPLEKLTAEAPPAPRINTPPPMTAEERVFAQEVQDRLTKAPSQNSYLRLGVNSNASQEAIKGAYLTLAKRFHPDRATGGLVSIQPDLQNLFASLKDAYESIATKEARARYDDGQRAGSKLNSRAEEASMALKMGEVLLRKRDFEGATAKLRRSVDLDANGDALAALAWALVADPKATPATKEEAASLVQRALRAQGVTARTYYVAGVLWRTKDPDSAVDAFRKALELDPNHSDAALELRLIEQRRGKQGKVGGGVLSGLLFGKRKG
jgi:hypothetical protein